jgi:phospholipase/carboxylesterase
MPALEQMIDRELSLTGLDRARLTLVGFSQGAMMALALAAGPRPPVRVVALAGRLAVPIAASDPEGGMRPAIFLGHGTADAVVPVAEAELAASRFEAAGFEVTRVIEQGLAHAISPSLALAAGDWLSRRDLAEAVAA